MYHYLHHGAYAFSSIALFVCLFKLANYSKFYEQVGIKLYGIVLENLLGNGLTHRSWYIYIIQYN